MKALTISQPYASLIASGEKWVENRSWGTPYRGPLAIHAGQGTQYMSRKQLRCTRIIYPTGCVIAVAQLVACINIARSRKFDRALELSPGITVDDVMHHSYTEGPWCWVLSEVQRLNNPVACRGMQGLWEFEFT